MHAEVPKRAVADAEYEPKPTPWMVILNDPVGAPPRPFPIPSCPYAVEMIGASYENAK
jgi:hypothetical protein